MGTSQFDIVCLSHLRWDFVFQRPQHLFTRFARERRTFFVEEPVFGEGSPRLEVKRYKDSLWVLVPRLPNGISAAVAEGTQRVLIEDFLRQQHVRRIVAWYYTPMAFPLMINIRAVAAVYDCMDELSAFRGAPAELAQREAELLHHVDLVFTGGDSLFQAKRNRHPNVHSFPSGIDAAHFARARLATPTPSDQAAIPRPRIGFCGVLDERLDIELVKQLAAARPQWSLVLLGPVAKIEAEELPKAPNIFYLGAKPYDALPEYFAGWDVAALFFARNEATRFISPTKTPEYLAAGKPVVSTSIPDVVRSYGVAGLVQIADDVPQWITQVEAALRGHTFGTTWLADVDRFLAGKSWDAIWRQMNELLESTVRGRAAIREESTPRRRRLARSAGGISRKEAADV